MKKRMRMKEFKKKKGEDIIRIIRKDGVIYVPIVSEGDFMVMEVREAKFEKDDTNERRR